MSTNLPPTGPPSGPPTGPPPSGPPPASGPPDETPQAGSGEVLEQGGGGPLPPGPPTGSGGGRRKGLVIGGVVGLLALGGAAFAGYTWLTATGPQPAEALPADTLGYVSVDLDPSGSQKIAALKTLEKFPAADEWLDEEGIGSGDDIRQFIFGKLQEEEGVCEDVDFDDDVQPLLGDRFAVAAIDRGEEAPAPVFVGQVSDPDDAQDRAEQLIEDCGGDPDEVGLAVSGDWLIMAETDDIADQVVDDAADANLADDEDFQKWTDAAGDPGILTAYAAPAAGKVLADELAGFADLSGAMATEDPFSDDTFGMSEEIPPVGEMMKLLEEFGGMALSVRFEDGGVEVESAGDFEGLGMESLMNGDRGGDVLATLPADTAVAFGAGFEPGWFEDLAEYIASTSAGGLDADDLIAEMESALDVSLPEDAETLLGESAAVAFGSDFDPEAFFDSGSLDLPIGVKIEGDPEAIEKVLEKIRATAPTPEEAEMLTSESQGEYVVVGPDPEYLSKLLEDGDLAGTETYQDVVRDDVAQVLFVDFDAGDGWLADLFEGDEMAQENLEPLAGLGLSYWNEDSAESHMELKVTTD